MNQELQQAIKYRDELKSKFESYGLGDRSSGPSVSIIRELLDAEARVKRLRGEP